MKIIANKFFFFFVVSTTCALIFQIIFKFGFLENFFNLFKQNSFSYKYLFAKFLIVFKNIQSFLLLGCSLLSLFWLWKQKISNLFSVPLIYLFLFFNSIFSLHFVSSKIIIAIYKKSYFQLTNISDINLYIFSKLIYWIITAFIIFYFLYSSFKTKKLFAKKFISINFLFFLGMGFFGIGMDFFNSNARTLNLDHISLYNIIYTLLVIFEELGEVVVIFLAFIWCLLINFPKLEFKKGIFKKIYTLQ